MDFVADALFDGRRFRALTIVDNYSRECLEIEVGQVAQERRRRACDGTNEAHQRRRAAKN
jgi:hypothetical protein